MPDSSAIIPPEDRVSRDTRRAVEYIRFAELALLIIVAAAVVYGMITWRNANNAAGRVQGRLDGILGKLEDKIDAVDVKGVNGAISDLRDEIGELKTTTAKAGEAIDGLKPVAANLATLEARIGDETSATLGSIRKGTIEPLRAFVTNLNETTTGKGGLIPTATASIATLNDSIKTGTTKITDLATSGQKFIETTDAGVKTILDNAGKLIITADGRVAALAPIEANAARLTDELASSAGNLETLSEGLLPRPCTTFWDCFKSKAKYLLTLVPDAAQAYWYIKKVGAVPVKIVAPLPK